ncbi:Protein MALE DISCOVERER 2 [Glycine soja]
MIIYICLIFLWGNQECWSINNEGLALLAFRARITNDPFNALVNWNPNDCDPCKWLGVHCVDGKVQMMELKGLSLEGTLAPELGKLSYLNSLVLCKNNFLGVIPKELGDLPKLELLDLGENNLSGNIPIEIGKMSLLKHLLKLRKSAFHGHENNYCDLLPSSNVPEIAHNVPKHVNYARRMLLQSSDNNFAAAPFNGESTIEISFVPITFSSGAFSAISNANKKQNQTPTPSHSPFDSPHDVSNENQTSRQDATNGASRNLWKYIISVVVVLIIIIIIILYTSRKQAAKVIGPWKTGISGQLQKAFITGVPKLNRAELEIACEDFSNIVNLYYEGCTIYKGTLSNGVEIAVVSTLITSPQDWSKDMEIKYHKKIDILSRINHKNFVNLIGYCEEEEPFTRMLVFEYAPNGNVFEHLHVEEMERLDWSERVRIIMGIAYCLQYLHHDLSPPMIHSSLASNMIFLTDDFAAKMAVVTFRDIVSPTETIGDSKKPQVSSQGNLESNVFDFGKLLLEIISGKLPYFEEQGTLVNWVGNYFNDKCNINYLIDPTLKSFKENELNLICEVIQDCIHLDPKLRPTMRDVTSKLKEALGVSPEQAFPRLSPLWWAEFEILSVEAT